MTVSLPALAVADVLEQIADAVHDKNALTAATARLGDKYGLLGTDIKDIVHRHGWPRPESMRRAAGTLRNKPGGVRAVAPPKGESKPGPKVRRPVTVDKKACTNCGETKPADEFLPSNETVTGLSSQCRTCNNRRNPTEARIVRNRARSRATAALVKAHQAEFDRIMATELEKAQVEHARLRAAAAGQHDAEIARLKPGPKRSDETDVVQRLDVARCTSCHTHHDALHECPNCGTETPAEKPSLLPYVVRDWAIAQGIGPVPTRGPIPQRILDAYLEDHPEAASA